MSAIPCKRPKVTAEPIVGSDLFTHTCHVPGCGWTFRSVKSAQEPKWHRDDHKRAFPKAAVVHDVEWDAYCDPCRGHQRTFGTRREAATWLDEHLVTEHGVVTC